MRKIYMSVLLIILLSFTGCEKDDRAKRAASLLNVKTQVAAKEFKAAKDDAERFRVIGEYFQNAGDLTQALEDYMFSREAKSTPGTSKPVVTP